MTEQITIKLNKNLFRPLIEELSIFGGKGITESDSDLAGKCLFFCHYYLFQKNQSGNTLYEEYFKRNNIEKAEAILDFLNKYQTFKKEGLNNQKKGRKTK